MAYSKLRGARKPKKKNEKGASITEQDAFQEQGKKLVDKLLAHPYFIWGTVGAIIIVVIVGTFVFSAIKSKGDKLAYEYAQAVESFEKISENLAIGKEESYSDTIKSFQGVISNQSGSFNAAASMVYIGKIYQKMDDCEKAVEYFTKAKKTGKLPENLLFGVYEGEAFCHLDKKEFDKSVEVWKKWLNKKTDIYKDYALYYTALSLEKSGNKEESLSYYKRLRDEFPTSLLIAKISDKISSEAKPEEVPVEN